MRKALLPALLLGLLSAAALAIGGAPALAGALPPALAEPAPAAPAAVQQIGDKSALVKSAFNLLYGGYVTPLGSDTLLSDAWDGMNTALTAAGAPAMARPSFTGDPATDWSLFSSGFQAAEQNPGVAPTDLAYGAIGQMAAARQSCHTAFLPPVYASTASGEDSHQPTVFTGFVADRDSHVVTRVYPDSPATQAGLQPGDTILTSAGAGNPGLLRRIVSVPAGTSIDLTVQRPGVAGAVALTLTPSLTVVPFIRTQILPGGIGVIQFDYFTTGDGLVSAVRQAIMGFEAQGVVGWVIDLRTSPGGELHTLGGLASLFLGKNVVETIYDRYGVGTVQNSDPAQALPVQRPLVILTEHFSASAADIFPGALQDDGRAFLIGNTTDGCVSSSREVPLADGSLLQLQTDQVLIGKDRLNLDGIGVTPNQLVLRTPEQLAAGEDTQMDAAVSYLLSAAGNQ